MEKTLKQDLEKTTLERIQDILFVELDIDRSCVIESAELIADLNLDSLAIMDMVVALEKKFSIFIAEHEIRDLKDIGGLVEFVERKSVAK